MRQRYELPGFTILLRAAKRARVSINNGYHRSIYQSMGKANRAKIDLLIARNSRNVKSL